EERAATAGATFRYQKEQDRRHRDECRRAKLSDRRAQRRLGPELRVLCEERRHDGQESETGNRSERTHVHMSNGRLDEIVSRAVELELAGVLPFTRGPVSEGLLPAFDVQIVEGRERCVSLPLEQRGEPVRVEGESSVRKDRDRQERA